jgi:hypothetical protein
MQLYILYRSASFWNMYEPHLHKWCYLAIALYILMYCLQLFWFSKILHGLLKALGFESIIDGPTTDTTSPSNTSKNNKVKKE